MIGGIGKPGMETRPPRQDQGEPRKHYRLATGKEHTAADGQDGPLHRVRAQVLEQLRLLTAFAFDVILPRRLPHYLRSTTANVDHACAPRLQGRRL